MPYRHELKGNALRCMTDPDHDTYQKKHTGTRMLYDGATGELKEYDIMSQRPTTELAPITDQDSAVATVSRAMDLGLFPNKNSSPQQLALLAQVALAYGLDPLMGEIMPYQGRPYITIAGRRRLDAAAGHRPSVSFRILNADEMTYYKSVDALAEKDVAVFCVLRREGETVEGFGRILASERAGDKHLPTVARTIEMAQKRAERRAREIMFGPVAKPESLRNIEVLEEGDEAEVVESTGRIILDDPNELPNLGNCPAHDVPWKVEEKYNKVRASHFVEGAPICHLDKLYSERFQIAYVSRFGEPEKKADVDAWLKNYFNGRTWSVMDAPQHVEAVRLLTMAAGATESDVAPPLEPEPPKVPDDDNEAPESSERLSNAELDLEVEREQEAAERMEH